MKHLRTYRSLSALAALAFASSLCAAAAPEPKDNWQDDPLYRQGEQWETTGSSIAIAGAVLGSASLLFNNAADCDKRQDQNCETKKNHRGRTGLALGVVAVGAGLIIAHVGAEKKDEAERGNGRAEGAKQGLDLGLGLSPEHLPTLSLALTF